MFSDFSPQIRAGGPRSQGFVAKLAADLPVNFSYARTRRQDMNSPISYSISYAIKFPSQITAFVGVYILSTTNEG